MATVVYAANTFDEVLATFEPGELGMAWTAYHKQVSASFLCVAAAPLVPQQIAILKFKGGDHVARALVGSTLNPNADTFKAFVDEISAYFTPPCTTIFCGYQMNKLTQRDGEGIDLFYERLVRLSKSAPFTDAQREAEIIKSMALGTNNSKLAGIILGTETPKRNHQQSFQQRGGGPVFKTRDKYVRQLWYKPYQRGQVHSIGSRVF